MTFDKFVGEVQNRARLGSLGDAVRAIRCTLGVLGLRLAGGEAKDLASQLPEEIGYYLMHAQAGVGMDFSADEFLDRVRACEGEDKPESIHHVRAVLEVLREAVSEGQMRHVLNQLPADFEALFRSGSEGRMRMKKARRTSSRNAAGRRGAIGAQQEGRPRSQRIATRARGAWHLGR